MEDVHAFDSERPSKLAHAVVDPERKLLLDVTWRNNSKVREPESQLTATAWAARWLPWVQDLLLLTTALL